ncbi:MAG: hypothetical protein AAGM67_10570, partial [Bacteroidota bacterium]
MTFPGNNYAPPNVYTQTSLENPVIGALEGLRIPVFIGEGNEILLQENLEVARGSSSAVDQQVVQEDQANRAVVSISATNQVTLGSFDGTRDRFQVRNFPIVSGDGSGTTTTDGSNVSVTINNRPVVVLSLDGTNGIIQLVETPQPGDIVRCTYFFNRTDTRTTDDVSAQVSSLAAEIFGQRGLPTGSSYTFDASNNVLTLRVDRAGEASITFPLGVGGSVTLAPVDV